MKHVFVITSSDTQFKKALIDFLAEYPGIRPDSTVVQIQETSLEGMFICAGWLENVGKRLREVVVWKVKEAAEAAAAQHLT